MSMIFFRVWFVFVAILALSAMGFSIYVAVKAFTLANDPAAIGRYVGEMQRGYNEVTK